MSSLVDGRPRKLMDAETAAVYTSGHLLFVRDHTVLAQPFDADRLTLVGTAFQVASEALGSIHEAGADAVSAAQNGNLAFAWATPDHIRGTRRIDRSGRHLGEVGPLDAGISPSASPNLSQLVVLRRTLEESNNDVWAMDTRRGLMTRLTTNPAEDVFPMWSAHGDRVIFSSNRGSRWGLYRTDSPVAANACSCRRGRRSCLRATSRRMGACWCSSLPAGVRGWCRPRYGSGA